uniref:Ctf8 n=1 Tax=Dracunculus medinensis TaxID=318479 RepID=A0A0N4UEV5_DRAME
LKEWTMIELQGSLESSSELSGQTIGILTWEIDKAYFLIGHHILEGKLTKLEKPFIVLSKNEQTYCNNITAIIRKKILFRMRPKPVVLLQQ